MTTAPTDEFDPEAYKRWTPRAQEEAAALLDRLKEPKKIFYCSRGPVCDGNPHDLVNYQHARGDQWPPAWAEAWMFWVLRGGRGSGKTRAGAEWTKAMSEHTPRIACIAPTSADARDTMIEGVSGLISVCERSHTEYRWEPSKRRFTFGNGAIATTFSGEEPDRLRGPQHGAAWLDEPAHYPNIEDVWSMMLFGLRMGDRPRVAITTTPTPIDWLKKLIADPRTVSSVVSTFANRANLSDDFLDEVERRYKGTRLGRQELYGEILMDVEGALWNYKMIEDARIHLEEGESLERLAQTMDRIVVAIDPAGTSVKRSDETGIIVVGVLGGRLYILADRSGKYTPERWARTAVEAYDHWQADCIVVENNYGGEMVRSTLNNISQFPRVREVNSRRGKFIRAEPVVSLYEQGRVHHVGVHEKLEVQMTEWVPGKGTSPDRLDALVHAAHELIEGTRPAEIATASGLVLPRTMGKKGAVAYTGLTRPTVRSWL